MNIRNAILAPIGRTGALVGFSLLAGQAIACDLSLWNGGMGGSPVAAQPNEAAQVSRYSGLCAMEAPTSVVSYVQDNSPGGIARIRARFYFLNELDSGSAAFIYRGYSSTSGSGPLFTIRANDAGTVALVDNATGSSVQQNAATDWVSVEIDWSQGSGDGVISLSVNGQTAVVDNTLSNSGAGLQSVRLGNLNGASGTLTFDAYESRRTTEIGRLLAGDANGNGSVTITDASAIVAELDGTLQSGQPDCNENGAVTITDASCVVSLL
ncbi:MAG: dockerin type I domain-containing protein [Candidatus Wenzhouxiangella sp. M2_3B_020]